MKTSQLLLAGGAAALAIYLIAKSKATAAAAPDGSQAPAGTPTTYVPVQTSTGSGYMWVPPTVTPVTAPPITMPATTPPATVVDPLPEQTADIVANLGAPPAAPGNTGAAASYLTTAQTGVTADTTGFTASNLPYTATNIAAGPRAVDLAQLAPLGTMFGRYAVVSYAAAQDASGNLYWYPVTSTTPS